MKRANPAKHGQRYCKFGKCNGNKVPAVWHDYWQGDACEKHKAELNDCDDGHMTEADYQTWGRL